MGTRFHATAAYYPYFVTTVVGGRRPIFAEGAAASLLIGILDASRTETGTQLLAYVVMPDHIHLLVVPGRLGLGHFMRVLKGRFARYWNQSQGRTGTVWQERYYETAIRTVAGLRKCIEYIHENPVVAGLSDGAASYPYSSACPDSIRSDLASYLSGTDSGQAEAWPSGGGIAERLSGGGMAERLSGGGMAERLSGGGKAERPSGGGAAGGG